MERSSGGMPQKIFRILFYIAGAFVLSCGLRLNTKANIGVSAVSGVSFVISEITGIRFGDVSLMAYVVFFIIELVLKGRKNIKMIDALQLPISVGFTRLLNLFGFIIPDTDSFAIRIIYFVIGIIGTGAGAAMMLDMRIVPVPADGVFQALSDRTGLPMGLSKNIWDGTCALISILIGVLATGHLIGINLGTIICAITVGRVVAIFEKLLGTWCREKAGLPSPLNH